MSKFIKAPFAAALAAVVFTAVARSVWALWRWWPVIQKVVRLAQLIHINVYSPYYLKK